MNKQEEVMVGLAHVPRRRYSSGIRITTVGECLLLGWHLGWGTAGQLKAHCSGVDAVPSLPVCELRSQHALPAAPHPTLLTTGNKSSLELRGPVEVPKPPVRPGDVPLIVAMGLRGAVHAAAAGAAKGVAGAAAKGADLLKPSALDAPSPRGSQQQAEEAPPLEPIHFGHLSAEASGGSPHQGLLPEASDDAAPAEPAAQAASPRKAAGRSPFDAPAQPSSGTQTAAASPRDLHHTSSLPVGIEARHSYHGPSPLGPSPLGSGSGTPTAAATFKGRHLRRASMQDNSLMETMSTQPGTMLVRVTSTTPTARQLRRM